MDDVNDIKILLDGDSKAAADAAPAILETRPGTCTQHGDYIDQKIPLPTYSGLRPITIPYWLGCPACCQLMDEGNRREAKQCKA